MTGARKISPPWSGISTGNSWLTAVALICLLPLAWGILRLLILMPALALDARAPTLVNAHRDASGRFWRCLLIFLAGMATLIGLLYLLPDPSQFGGGSTFDGWAMFALRALVGLFWIAVSNALTLQLYLAYHDKLGPPAALSARVEQVFD